MLFTPVRSRGKQPHVRELRQNVETRFRSMHVLTDADAILAMLPGWIEDYCEFHPHSGLKFRSPREFFRLNA
jgi:transposase InsO family protein